MASGVSIKGMINGYPNLKEELDRFAARENQTQKSFGELMPELLPPVPATTDAESMVLKSLAIAQLPAGCPLSTDSTTNKFAMLVWKMLDACESGSTGGDACRMSDVISSAVHDIITGIGTREYKRNFYVPLIGTNKAVQFEHGVGLVLALLNHGLFSWIQRGDPDRAQQDINRLGKMLEGVFKVPEATLVKLGISTELRQFGIENCEGLKQHFKKEANEYSCKLKFKYIVVPRTPKAKLTQAASTATPPTASADGAGQAKRPLEFSDVDTPSKTKKKAKATPAVPVGVSAELAAFTHPAAAKLQAWVSALADVRNLQKGAWQLRCTQAGTLRVLVVAGGANLFALNRTIAAAFGWGVGVFEHSVNKGTTPQMSGFLVDPPSVADGRAIVSAKRSADGMAGCKGMAFLAERSVKICQVFRARGDTATYKCGGDTVMVVLDGIDPGTTRHLPRCVGADASLGSSNTLGLAGNLKWMRLNDVYRGDRAGESLIISNIGAPSDHAACFMNNARRPLFDNTGARIGLYGGHLNEMLRQVAQPFV